MTMPEIVLTEEQAKVLAGTAADVVVRDPTGVVVGVFNALDVAALARHRERGGRPRGPFYPDSAVRAGLDALEAERQRLGRLDFAYALDFLRRLEAADPAKYGPRESA
jgi:hypothetical protein